MGVLSIKEAKFLALRHEADRWSTLQQRASKRMVRLYPSALRTDSSNPDPLLPWTMGVQMVALNLQVNDLPTQLHHALFALGGGLGYVLKPAELRGPGEDFPPAREVVTRLALRIISLHQLPTAGERRPHTAGRRAASHEHVRHLTDSSVPTKASAAAVSSPSVRVELHALAGFCCASEAERPTGSDIPTQFKTAPVRGNGLAAYYGDTVHCIAAEPLSTVLRVVVVDGESEVAYETAVLGALRTGYRCFQLRQPRTGTRIELCSLLVHIEATEEPHLWAEAETLRKQVMRQQVALDEQAARIRALEAELSQGGGGGGGSSTPAETTVASGASTGARGWQHADRVATAAEPSAAGSAA